jgi:DNA-damage-inducible protein J
MMASNALVQTRIDADIRDRASAVLESVGMTVSDAVRVLLTRTANEGAVPLTPVHDAAYDAWFRAKVREALDDPRPRIPHAEVMARAEKRRAELRSKLNG